MKRTLRSQIWIKAQRKYRNLQKRIAVSADVHLNHKIELKLEQLGRRLLAMNRKWKLGIASSILLTWMAMPTQTQAQTVELSSLDGTDGFVINGANAGDDSGGSVSGIGDINNDGIEDLVIGGNSGNSNTGQAYVVFGSNSAFSSAFELSSLNGTNGFVINGITVEDNAGDVVGKAGDVNGDGINDLIIGAPGADPNNTDAGQSYVVFGKSTAFSATLNLSSLNGTDGFIINGIDGNVNPDDEADKSGSWVSAAGDINDDGFDDIMISAPYADPNGVDSGEVYVIFGKDTGMSGNFTSPFELSSLNGTNGFVINGVSAGGETGKRLGQLGDINGDNIDDIIIGAPFKGSNDEGISYVLFGDGSGFGNSFELSSLDGSNGFVINGVASSYAGFVGHGGDMNGDGLNDIVIGGPVANAYAGQSYIVFGRNTGFSASLDLTSLVGTNGFAISGVMAGDGAGWSNDL